jgi:type IV pilus secretin PilQ/predicted competence protein
MRAKLAGLGAIVFVALGAATTIAQDKAPTAISDIRQENTERATRLIVVCTGPLAYTYYSPDPLTLVVDVPEVDASKVPSRINVGTREVESLRVTSLARADGRSLARLEVRLASLVPYQIYSKGRDLNLVFERPAAMAAVGPRSPEAAVAPGAPPVIPPVTAPERSAAVAPETAPAAPADTPAPPAAAPAERTKAPEAPVRNPVKATQILSVAQDVTGGKLAVDVKADGHLAYQDFFLGNPDRLVIDFADVTAKAPVRTLEVNQGPVRKVRLGQFSAASPKVARLVLDLSARTPYRIEERTSGVKILFGEGSEPAPAPLAAMRTAPEPVAAGADSTASLDPGAQGPVTILPAPGPGALTLPALPEPQITEAGSTVDSTAKQYTGTPISLDFKDGDLQDIFRLFADISGLNVVVNPGVGGKVTLKLTEVPWDQALDLILKTNGLGYVLEDNVIRIAKLSDLQREEQEQRKLQEEKALAGELIDYTKRISYAKAATISTVLKAAGALSARGQINVDERTNTLIMRDLPSFVDKARALIGELDRATPQVEIEARIVVTSRNFTRDLGIQWGFNSEHSVRYGNTTNLTFPNAMIINGTGVPAVGGIPADQLGQASDAGIGLPGRGYAVNLPASGFNTGLGISLGNIIGSFNLDLALTALERQGRGRLLSTPKVTTQNNQSAEIKQGVQIPIQTVANNTVTVSFKDAVLTLKVTPQITDAGTVILQLEVENNSADFANLVNGIPPINTQSAKTIVLVKDGSTAVVGGIYQSNEQTSQQSTPFLSKLPILGYLFRNRFITNTNNELLLFITPRIVKG